MYTYSIIPTSTRIMHNNNCKTISRRLSYFLVMDLVRIITPLLPGVYLSVCRIKGLIGEESPSSCANP